MTMNIDDSEFLANKLQGYAEVKDVSTLKEGDHLRVTSNKYKEEGRKCSYIILKKLVEGVWICNSYKPIYKDWGISIDNPYKKYRFYKKEEKPYTGKCFKCNISVKSPYRTCYNCSSNTDGHA